MHVAYNIYSYCQLMYLLVLEKKIVILSVTAQCAKYHRGPIYTHVLECTLYN